MSNRGRGRPAHPDLLTPAEWRVTEFVRHGLTNRAIAELHGVSVDAIKFHVGNVLTKLGFDRRDQLRRWKGVRADSNLVTGQATMETPITLGAIGQIARSVKDVAAAEKWYAEILGLRHLYTFGKLAFFDCDGVRLFITESDADGSAIIYFRVADIHAAHAQLEARGVEFSNAPHLIHRHSDGTEEWMAFFNDNEGRPLAIMAQVPRSSEGSTDDVRQA